MRIKTARCALFPPGFLLELFVSVSLFLFVLYFLTHVDLINFISSVISAFAGADYTLAYLNLQDSRVPKIEKRDNEKKNRGGNWGEEGRRHCLRPWMLAAARKRSHQWYVSLTQTIITQLKD